MEFYLSNPSATLVPFISRGQLLNLICVKANTLPFCKGKYPNLLGGWVRFGCNNTEPEGGVLRGFFHLANFPNSLTVKK